MTALEPLDPLAAAVAHEARRLEAEFAGHGMDFHLTVRIDAAAGAVVVEGDGLKIWGPRTRMEAMLGNAGLAFETRMPAARMVVRPSSRG